MAKYNLGNYLDKDGIGFPLNFRRGNPNPLDNSSVWPSLESAQNYAKGDPVAYVGQILTVVENLDNGGTKVSVYSIQDESGNLEEICSGVDLRKVMRKSTFISILANAWTGSGSIYSQVVAINGVTANSQIDLYPTAAQIVALQDAEVSLVAENDDGVVKVWAIGDKPNEDMNMRVTITEVVSV